MTATVIAVIAALSIWDYPSRHPQHVRLRDQFAQASRSGDTIYLEDIIWRNDDDIIFSNHPVRSVNGHRVTYGDGFSSDERLENLHISHQRGVIEFND